MNLVIVHRFTLQLDRRGRLVRRCVPTPLCGVPGCKRFGSACWLPGDDWDKPSEHYCTLHAYDQGYCPGCGNFWAGVESFDFSRTGLCENCAGQGDYDDYDDDDAVWFDPFDDDLRMEAIQ